jgi:hypothetical protein
VRCAARTRYVTLPSGVPVRVVASTTEGETAEPLGKLSTAGPPATLCTVDHIVAEL